ncbi:hypothetical protein SAMN05660293_02664 [Dyadobacter psychrophilus]|uniref:Uncharacterized protein n=1 Tax=Dyadobacter psychrophilus TaxID=651661 RepID=A0A1T5EPS6_9BACT|nr:hypothetical protein SAMN05660293_02664 [Dyadobacter psychrophilus]
MCWQLTAVQCLVAVKIRSGFPEKLYETDIFPLIYRLLIEPHQSINGFENKLLLTFICNGLIKFWYTHYILLCTHLYFFRDITATSTIPFIPRRRALVTTLMLLGNLDQVSAGVFENGDSDVTHFFRLSLKFHPELHKLFVGLLNIVNPKHCRRNVGVK